MTKTRKDLFPNTRVGIIVISTLLLVIFLLQVIALTGSIFPDLSVTIYPLLKYFTAIYVTMMYLGFALLIWLEAKHLEEFNIDRYTIVTLLIGSFIRRRIGFPGEGLFLLLIGFSGVLIIVVLISKKATFLRTRIRWVLTGLGLSIVVIILIFLLELFVRDPWQSMPLFRNNLVATVIGEMVKEFSFGALIEELLFRGFLWGYMRRAGFNENSIAWTQGLLFWLLHIGKVITPFTLFVVIPCITIIFTYLTKRSKQLYPSIISHTVINVISSMLNLATY